MSFGIESSCFVFQSVGNWSKGGIAPGFGQFRASWLTLEKECWAFFTSRGEMRFDALTLM